MDEMGGDPRADVGALVQELVQRQEHVATIEVPRLGEDAIVSRAELGQLGLGRLRADLQLVDLLQEPGQQAGGVAADLTVAKGQIVEAVEHDRKALRRPEHVEERIEPGRRRVLAQQPLDDRLPSADPELLVAPVEKRFHPLAQALGCGPVRGEDEDSLGCDTLAGEPGEAAGKRLRLSGSGRAKQ